MAPSILASSDRRWGLKAASSRKPPEQMLSTSGPSPTTISAPIFDCRIRSRPSRNGLPGATRRQRLEQRVASPAGHRPKSIGRRLAVLQWISASWRASPSVAARTHLDALGGGRATAGGRWPAVAESHRLGQAPRALRHLAQLAAQADLAEGHEPVGQGRSRADEASARATTEIDTRIATASHRLRPARRRRTGPDRCRPAGPARPAASAAARRRGPAPSDGVRAGVDFTTSAWTSTSSGRWPSMVGTTTEPETSVAPIGQEQAAGVGHRRPDHPRSSRTGRARRSCRTGAWWPAAGAARGDGRPRRTAPCRPRARAHAARPGRRPWSRGPPGRWRCRRPWPAAPGGRRTRRTWATEPGAEPSSGS